MHAVLTYRQAVRGFLTYPIFEDKEVLVRISASIMWELRDSFDVEKLGEEETLCQIFPTNLIQDNKEEILTEIQETYRQLAESVDPKEATSLSMGRSLYELQALKLFGASWWKGKQVMSYPAKDLPIKHSTAKMCPLQPELDEEEEDTEYWIAVDSFGLRFISGDFVRGFLFNANGIEKLLQSAAKGSILQLVVATSLSRSPRSIIIKSKEAIDIAYMIHMIIQANQGPEAKKKGEAQG